MKRKPRQLELFPKLGKLSSEQFFGKLYPLERFARPRPEEIERAKQAYSEILEMQEINVQALLDCLSKGPLTNLNEIVALVAGPMKRRPEEADKIRNAIRKLAEIEISKRKRFTPKP